ncbi:uroporphyrinogen-III C-methyltransferase [Hydrogenivirga sp. 128-5-R1-1]|uniref:uroporphyrinogen-III C-methyltransferase n=1 Tax=Hydrogenivirga sp. 128-5-R1-1 TaxID=392423 RepID=UPI00015F155D|nr:uroporphyrinogen-III C-methyltransferase [Hydrogenivirga sp. 128-5-R1-1]EDP74747.1 uroporphyrin-III c-methyltransferase [Hydrogenivirga sp. 128-5-R1-1]
MGKVYLVGAGPGDPELLTLKAVKVISSADVILYDRLVCDEVLSYAKPECKLVYVGKEDGKHTIPQEEINRLLVYYASSHERVVRLKGGDPFIFGRGGEEALYLKRYGIPYEVVPGVSSLYSVPAYAGIPLTFRGVASSFAVVTGHEATGKEKSIDWKAFKDIDTLVILMGVKNRQRIAQELVKLGRKPSEPVAFVERGTTPEQRVVVSTLGEVAKDPPEVSPPAIMVVGQVVGLQGELSSLLENLKKNMEGVYNA